MVYFLILAGVVAVLVVLWKLKSTGGRRRVAGKRARKAGSRASASSGQADFPATRIVPGANACQAAKDLQDELFLDSHHNTPTLPLDECTNVSGCDCKYAHQNDRRTNEKDRRLQTLQTELYTAAEGDERRRPEHGRRKTDSGGV